VDDFLVLFGPPPIGPFDKAPEIPESARRCKLIPTNPARPTKKEKNSSLELLFYSLTFCSSSRMLVLSLALPEPLGFCSDEGLALDADTR